MIKKINKIFILCLLDLITIIIFLLLLFFTKTIENIKQYDFYISNFKEETICFLNNKKENIIPKTEKDFILKNDLILTYYINPISIDENQITSCKKELEKITSICDNEIQNRVNEYLAQQRKAKILNEISTRGIAGRFSCPSVGIDVALFNSNSQAVVDAGDSAAWFSMGGNSIIGDHNNQGFNNIKRMIPGSTISYIEYGNSKQAYICSAKFLGHNTGFDLTDANGISIAGRNTGGITLYTCNENWQNITIVFLSPI